jgi:ABC-2 type transport system ATP-binding protein
MQESALSFQEVSKQYHTPTGHLQALDSISFNVEPGEFFGLLGPNGAGKTTLISILAGLLRASSGKTSVLGYDVVENYEQAKRHLGIVPQELVFDPFFTVYEALHFQSGYFGIKNNRPWIEELLEGLGLSAKADTNTRALSGGMKRRVLVAQALVHKPPVIVLDEPTAGVDVELRQTLWRFISDLNKRGHTVLLTTHYLEEAESLCTRIAMLKAGKAIALERTSTLLNKASSNVIAFKTDTPLPTHWLDKARVTGRLVQVKITDTKDIQHLLTDMDTLGATVENIEIRKTDLEDVFLELMQEQKTC